MLTFHCRACGARLTAPDSLRGGGGGSTICPNCNTRNPIPDDAGFLPDPPAPPSPPVPPVPPSYLPAPSPLAPQPPDYLLINLAGWIVMIIGFIVCFLSIPFAIMAHSLLPLLPMIIEGILTAAFGALLHLLRNLAVDVWYLRHGLAHWYARGNGTP